MTEASATAEAGVPATDLRRTVEEFVGELKTFRDDIQNRLTAQDTRMTMLDRKAAFRGRSPLSTDAQPEAPHQKAFAAYVRSGDEDALRGLGVEQKAISVADGGFLMPPQVAENVQSALRAAGSLRAIANVVQVEGASYDVLIETGDTGTAWANDAAATAETAAAGVARITVPLHELSAMPKASQRLLDDAAFDVEAWLAERIAERFGRAEAAAFINGDGSDKPRGLTQVPEGDADSDDPGQIGSVGGLDLGFADESLIDLVYALHPAYRANACFVMNSKTAAVLRRLKDADGRFLWADTLAQGEPARLLGHPVMISEDMPEMASGAAAIFFGDFHAGYTVVERPELRVLRDPFSAKPHVLFYATKRVGGAVTDGRAIKRLNFA